MVEQAYEFEKFPRGKLPAQLTRRQFFSGLMNEVRAFARLEEHPVFRLCDLGDTPNQELAWIVPIQVPGGEIHTEQEFVWGKAPETPNAVRLFPANSPAYFVLEQFNGERTIVDTSRNLAEHTAWDKQRAFAYVRGVFLWLVLAKLFTPRGKRSRR